MGLRTVKTTLTIFFRPFLRFDACDGERRQAFKRKTGTDCLTELPVFPLARTTKQTSQCQSVGDRLQNCVRVFR